MNACYPPGVPEYRPRAGRRIPPRLQPLSRNEQDAEQHEILGWQTLWITPEEEQGEAYFENRQRGLDRLSNFDRLWPSVREDDDYNPHQAKKVSRALISEVPLMQ